MPSESTPLKGEKDEKLAKELRDKVHFFFRAVCSRSFPKLTQLLLLLFVLILKTNFTSNAGHYIIHNDCSCVRPTLCRVLRRLLNTTVGALQLSSNSTAWSTGAGKFHASHTNQPQGYLFSPQRDYCSSLVHLWTRCVSYPGP